MFRKAILTMAMAIMFASVFFMNTAECSAAGAAKEDTRQDSATGKFSYRRDASGNILIYKGTVYQGTFMKDKGDFVAPNKSFVGLVEYQPAKYKMEAADHTVYYFDDTISKTVTGTEVSSSANGIATAASAAASTSTPTRTPTPTQTPTPTRTPNHTETNQTRAEDEVDRLQQPIDYRNHYSNYPTPPPTPTPGGSSGGTESFPIKNVTPSYYEAFCN
jgi:hypothetical protein